MTKLLWKIIKLVPLLILVGGFLKGSESLRPALDLGGVVFTQYELKKILKMVKRDFLFNKGRIMDPSDFHANIEKKYYNKWSFLIRKFTGHKGGLTHDIWETPFKLMHDQAENILATVSSGPDLEWNTPDDIKIPFVIPNIKRKGGARGLARKGRPSRKKLRKYRDRDAPRNYEYDEDGYDRNGFDQQGFDRQGFDRQGFNIDGFDRDGYDREGYDRDGLHASEK